MERVCDPSFRVTFEPKKMASADNSDSVISKLEVMYSELQRFNQNELK